MAKLMTINKEENKEINKLFWRSMTSMSELTFVKLQGPGFGYTLMPYLREIYKEDDDAYYEALERHTTYFNTNPAFLPFIAAIAIQMEKEYAEKKLPNVTEAVNGVKIGLMGPLAGMGDSLFTNTIRVIAAGVAMGFASTGNILAPILYLLIWAVPFFATRYLGARLGWSVGASFITKAQESGILQSITKGFGVLGLFMVGAMTYQTIGLRFKISGVINGLNVDLQTILDSILKGFVPLALTMFLVYMMKKKGKSNTWGLLFIVLLSVVLGFFGLA